MARICAAFAGAAALAAGSAFAAMVPTFTDPVSLVTWLIQHSGHRGFDYGDERDTAGVFSPGLRAALRASFTRSRQNGEPPCGANGDIILETQEGGAAQNLKLASQQTEPGRVAESASFDVDGYHRSPRYMTVLLDGSWKIENIINAEGTSLRRSLDCRR